MTVDYMTVAHTMLAPINEQLIFNFVYSLLLLFYSLLQTLSCVHCVTVSLSIHVFDQANVHKLIIDLLRNVTSYTALFQYIVMIIAILS